jgi:hypothetical protein
LVIEGAAARRVVPLVHALAGHCNHLAQLAVDRAVDLFDGVG